jgi:uncharacterized membrane protein YsdA (DUF1294 family)
MLLQVMLAWLLVINVATAAAYAYDKVAAWRGGSRIRERTLLLVNVLGGFIGAWIVFLLVRHKTRHRSFWLVQSLATLLWIAIFVVAPIA